MNIQTDYDILFQTFSAEQLNNALFEAIGTSTAEKDHNKIKALLTAGANIHAQNNSGNTPLMVSVLNKDDITFNMLLELGVDIHQKGDADQTALMYAAASGYLIGVNILLAKGADMHAVDTMGCNAFWYAKFNMKTSMMHYLLSKMSSEDHQDLINHFYTQAFPTMGELFNKGKMSKYLEFCGLVKNFNDELQTNRKKLCTILFADGLGLPHHAVMERPCSPTEKAALMPDVIKQIFALRALKSAGDFPEWYALSCLEKDINFFLNWKPVTPKTYGEVVFDTLTAVQNIFVSSFNTVRNYATSGKRKRDDNDDVGRYNDDNKRRRLN